MKCLIFVALVLLYQISITLAQQSCASANTNSTSGYNSDCPNGAPYCMGECFICNPYLAENFYCDCGQGFSCVFDTTSPSTGTCSTSVPKYGQTCNSDSDCMTTFNGIIQVKLLCVAGTCRMCDPADNITHVCSIRSSQYPNTKICISPGLWANAGSTSTASASTTNVATTTAQGSTSTTGGDR